MYKHIIFHIPMHLNRARTSASGIRPFKLIAAFKNLGYKVDVVEGYGKERKKQISEIKKKINSGIHYDFLYSESSTMPTLLTEKNHFPKYPCLDFSFFAFCKRAGIPIGLFYRDIYWCFANRNKDWKQSIAKYFYRYDLRQYEKFVDVLFLPTMEMFKHIPFNFDRQVVELPSGCDLYTVSGKKDDRFISLLYIGGIGGDYNLIPFMEAVSKMSELHLTLCCRKNDWDKVKGEYGKFENAQNITIVHKKGDELKLLYEQADVFALLYSSSVHYLQFAAPFKLFEAIGYGIPLLGYRENWSGKFIEKQGIGMACDNTIEDLSRCLHSLCKNKALLLDYRNRVSEIAPQHTWENRCRQIAETLTKKNSK